MKKVILFLLLIFSLNAYAVDYRKDYYPYISRAELAIVQEDYSLALQQYQTAFGNVPHVFLKDYYNASVCATLLQKYELSFVYLAEMAKLGFRQEQVLQNATLTKLQKLPEWQEFIKNYPKYREIYSTKFDKTYKNLLDSYYHQALNLQQEDYEQKENREKLYQKNDSLLKNFQELIQKRGFPQEAIYSEGILEIPPQQMFLWLALTFVIDTSSDDPMGAYRGILEEAVKNGQLSPYLYAHLSDVLAVDENIYNAEVLIYIESNQSNNTYYAPTLSETELSIINNNRAKLGIGTVRDNQQLCKYRAEKNMNSDFYIHPDYYMFSQKVNRKYFKFDKSKYIVLSLP